MTRDESIPIGTVSAEQIKQAREGAAALDLAEIERRHAERVRRLDERDGLGSFPEDEHADIGALLAALREARAEVERLRPIVEAVADVGSWGPESIGARAQAALGRPVRAAESLSDFWEATRALNPRPAGTLASPPADGRCEGVHDTAAGPWPCTATEGCGLPGCPAPLDPDAGTLASLDDACDGSDR